jgi:predicted HNH restriction endonuclease
VALLARAVGYRTYNAVNLNYGKLAGIIKKRLGNPPEWRNYVNLYALATWVNLSKTEGDFTFQMRPQLARALERLGWVKGARAPDEPSDPAAYLEGEERRLFIRHRQRDARLRKAKLSDVLKKTARLRCEVPRCGFDFTRKYGDLGYGFAEVHHLVPLHKLRRPKKNRLQDVAVICSNCHRMIHRYGQCRPLNRVIPAAAQ